jgi:hypothetical protein
MLLTRRRERGYAGFDAIAVNTRVVGIGVGGIVTAFTK